MIGRMPANVTLALGGDSLTTDMEAREELKVCCDVLLENPNCRRIVEERAGYTDRIPLSISH